MSELISKQTAIDALKEHRALYCDNTPDTFSKLSYTEKSRVDELDTAIATLVNLPSAQPHWIPCGDRLPKKDGLYLCWYEYYHWNKEKILPEYGIGYYDSDFNFWGGEVTNGKDAKVLAWMPLPDPYKGEQHEID